MNYQEFLTTIKTQLSLRIDADATLDIRRFTKNNGTDLDGLIIFRPNLNISPTIYLNPYYHRYLQGVPMEDIYTDILITYQEHLPSEDIDVSFFTDFSKAKKLVTMRLVNYKQNEKMLQEVPHFRYHDLAIIFYCLLHANKENNAHILIHNSHLDIWKISKEALYQVAKKNTPKLLPHQLMPLTEVLLQSHYICDEDIDKNDPQIYILTNNYRTNGATALLYEKLLSQIADSFEKDLLILPSSIHEGLILPIDSISKSTLDHYGTFIREINETQLADDEVLSDHAYYFQRATQMISY